MSASFPINNTVYWHVEHANQGHYTANTLVLASDGNIYHLTGTATTDPTTAGQTDWTLFGGSSLALAAAGDTTSTTEAISPAAVVALIMAVNAAGVSTAAIAGVNGGAASNVQQILEELVAKSLAQESIFGQHLGSTSTSAGLDALADVDGTAAREAGDWAILDTAEGGREAGIYVYDGTAFPATPAFQFPDVYAQRAPQTIPLTTGTAAYQLAAPVPSAADLDRMTVSISGSAGLTRNDWAVDAAGLMTFTAPTSVLLQTGMSAQVTF